MSIPLDPIEPTAIGPGVVAIPLAPTVWDDAEDGQHAVTADDAIADKAKASARIERLREALRALRP